MPTLNPKFVTAVNANGEKQQVPRAWLEEGHRFAGQFRLTPQQKQLEGRSEEPSESWTVPQLREHAERVGIDLAGASTKADVLAAITTNTPRSGDK